MSPDTEHTGDAPDPFRRTIEVAEGPNVDGVMQQIVDTHTRAADETAPAAVVTESSLDRAVGEMRAIESDTTEG